MGARSEKCKCPDPNYGGYIICKDCTPKRIKEAIIISNNILGLYTHVLISESKKLRGVIRKPQKRRDK